MEVWLCIDRLRSTCQSTRLRSISCHTYVLKGDIWTEIDIDYGRGIRTYGQRGMRVGSRKRAYEWMQTNRRLWIRYMDEVHG